MDLELRHEEAGSWTVLTVAGELDLHTSVGLRDQLAELTGAGTRRLAVDLSSVPFMDSSTLGVVVVALKRLRELGGELALIAVNGSPAKVLSITGMDRVIPSYATVGDLPQD